MVKDGWEFWKVTTAGGELAWLALTRPAARAAIDRKKVWTLVPKLRVFIANWLVTEDFASQDGPWIYENIGVDEARDLVVDVPDLTADALSRIVTQFGVAVRVHRPQRFESGLRCAVCP